MSIGDGIAFAGSALAFAAVTWAYVWNNVRISQIKIAAYKDGVPVGGQ